MQKSVCQNCKNDFVIEQEDLDFYRKIKVPPPTFCPECRCQRRMSWRNDRILYKRTCDATGKNIASCYRKDAPFPVYKREYWYSDKWDPMRYGFDYDFSKPFFEQFRELTNKVPKYQAFLVNSTGSEYSNYTVESKNCYFCFTSLGGNEDCSYSSHLTKSKNCFDCHLINQCERCFECVNCENCLNLQNSIDCVNCSSSAFLENCDGCIDCAGCVFLRNKTYCILNEQYTKETYEQKLKELKLDTWEGVESFAKKVAELSLKYPKKFMHGRLNNNVSGDYINDCKNVKNSYLITNNEDCKHVYYSKDSKSYYDVLVSFLGNEYIYESHAIPRSNYMVKFCNLCANGNREIEYCDSCESSSNLFGCVGLRRKEYCILNKQYSKEEYFEIKEKIMKQMEEMPYIDKEGRIYKYGEFFPVELSPFAYNESTAQDFFFMEKSQIEESGFPYVEIEKHRGSYQPTMKARELPPTRLVGESIIKEVIACQSAEEGKCSGTGVFRVTENEFNFYKNIGIPLPRKCPNCRMSDRIKKRNPIKLWQRNCMCEKEGHGHENKCPNEFETTYAPERPETIYCERCYQQEMY